MLAVAAATAAAPAHADPTLPAGWVPGGPAATMAAERAPGKRSREALLLASSSRRPVIAPVPVALEGLDVVDVEPTLTEQEVDASNADVAGERAAEVIVFKGCDRASVSGHAVGQLQIGWVSEPIGPQSSGGPGLYGVRGSLGLGDGRHRFALARWETLDRLPDSTLRYTEGTGRFEIRTCKTTLASRTTAIARPVLGGLAYAFRTRCARCSPTSREVLHVITPNPSTWEANLPYGHQHVLLSADGADSTRVQIERPRLDRFVQAFGRVGTSLRPDQDLLLGVEAAKGLGEAAPSVIAYATGVPHTGF
jgi:hypothetical protein